MVVLKAGTVRITPRGIELVRPLRLMISPFAKEGAAMQWAQPWVGRPDKLKPAQIKRTKALAEAAKAAKGTFGTVTNPKTGRPMPAIAAKVAETIAGKLAPEERLRRRREAARKYAEKKRRSIYYQRWKAMAGV